MSGHSVVGSHTCILPGKGDIMHLRGQENIRKGDRKMRSGMSASLSHGLELFWPSRDEHVSGCESA